MDFIEFTGKTVDDALTNALVEFGVTSDQIDYDVLEKGSSGFLGFNSKPAKIKARKKYTVADHIKNFLSQVFAAMGLEVEILINASTEEENVYDVELKGNEMGVLLLDYICKTRAARGEDLTKKVAVTTIVSSAMVDALAEEYGFELRRCLTGFKYIGDIITSLSDAGEVDRFIFGFEESYGFLSSTFVRDKDGVNASLLIAEVACACAAQGITLYDYVQSIFREYGYFVEKVVSKTLPGKDGLTRMKEIMKDLRENPPKELCGMRVTAVRDYLKGTRTADGKVEPTGLPKSDVLYFELEKGNWVCVRPSGTEPKIKLYVNTNASDKADAEKLNADLRVASEALLD